MRRTVRSGRGGFVDETLRPGHAPGVGSVTFRAGDRSATAPLHIASPEASGGVVCDIDDTAMITGLAHPLRAAYRTFARTSSGAVALRDVSSPGGEEGAPACTVEHVGRVPVVRASDGEGLLRGLDEFLGRQEGGRAPGGAHPTDSSEPADSSGPGTAA